MKLDIKIEKEDMGFTYDSVKSLISKLKTIKDNENHLSRVDVHLNFNKAEISNLGLAILWRQLYELRKTLNCEKRLWYLGTSQSFFDESHFLERLTGNKPSFLRSSAIPLHFESFSPVRSEGADKAGEISNIFSAAVEEFLSKTNDFHNELKIQMAEVINNAFDHCNSATDAGSICYYDEKNGYLDFCIADMGQGIKKSFLSNILIRDKYVGIPDEKMIKLATNFLESCNPVSARNVNYKYSNGGIGLYFLREFVKNHKNCYLVIISKKGYYYIDGESREKIRNLGNVDWNGTVVSFRFFTRQPKSKAYADLTKEFVEAYDSEEFSRVSFK